MPRDYNIYFNIGGGSVRQAYNNGNAIKNSGTLDTTQNNRMSEDGDAITQGNLANVLKIGLMFNLSQKANELVGAYTENRLKQKKFENGMLLAKYGVGLAVNPAVGGTYVVGDLAYRGISYSIQLQKKNKEALYYRQKSGNNANSGRRYGGSYL